MNTNELLDAVKAQYSIESDYKLAHFLGIRQQTISGYRQKGIELGDETALLVADKLGLDPGVVLAWIHAARTKSPAARAALLELARRATKSAAAVIAWGFVASAAFPVLLESLRVKVCILCQIDRRTPQPA